MLPKTDNWTCEENQKIPLSLFVQRARELLLHNTSFVNKPITASVFLLTKELDFLFTQNKKTPHQSTDKHINLILEEFDYALSNDEVAKDLIGDRFDYIKIIFLSKADCNQKIDAARFLRSRIARIEYLKQIENRISEIIEAGGIEKSRLISLTDCAINAILDAGYPSQTIYYLLNKSFINTRSKSGVNGTKTLNKFFSYFDIETHAYTIFFTINEITSDLQHYLPDEKFKLITIESEEFNAITQKIPEKNKNFFLSEKTKAIIIAKEVFSLDPQSARTDAEEQLSILADLALLKMHRFKLNTNNEALVYRIEKDEFVNSNRPKVPIMRTPHDKNISLNDIDDFISNLSLIDHDSLKRITRAVQLHSSAIKSTENESQLINLWIALETLFIRNSTESKLEKIINCVTPYIEMASIFYELNELTSEILQNHQETWDLVTSEEEFLSDLIPQYKLLAMISLKDLESTTTKFLSHLDKNPLLRHKIFKKIKAGQKAEDIKLQTDTIRRKIRYDISRIYRARNQIVHIGYSASDLSEIVQKTHHYLDVILTIIELTIGRSGGAFSIEQSTMEIDIMSKTRYSKISHTSKSSNVCTKDNFINFHLGRLLLA